MELPPHSRARPRSKIAQIKATDPTARVIIVTDYDQLDLREAVGQAGACGYVLKENLLELVRLLEEFPEEERGL